MGAIEEQNKELARRFLAVLTRADAAAADALCDTTRQTNAAMRGAVRNIVVHAFLRAIRRRLNWPLN